MTTPIRHTTIFQPAFRLKRLLFPVVVWIGLCAAAGAQTEANVEPDSNIAETGNPFRLHLIVSGTSEKPAAPEFAAWDSVMPSKNILGQTEWKQENGRWTKDLTLIAFDADTLIFPPLPVHLGNGKTVATRPLSLPVIATPAPDDLNDMAGVKDIHRENVRWTDYLPWIIGIIVILAAFFAVFLWLSRRGKKQAVRRTIELPPHELALKKLDVLQSRQLWQQGSVKEYYAELSHILREYLHKRFDLPVLESTSEETILRLKDAPEFPGTELPDMQELLQQADLAKFAKATPPDTYHEKAWTFAQQLVRRTVRREPEVNKSA